MINNVSTLCYRLKDKARQLGLSPVGITKAAPLEETRTILEQISRTGGRIPFTVDSVSRRTDPKLVWPEAESIVMVGFPYQVPTIGPSTGRTLKGYFAAGTYELDYHRVLIDKLSELGTFLQSQVPQAEVFPFVDTGPLVERALAYRAGLGVWGENSFLIRPQHGPAFFLGGLATNAVLAPDHPLTDSCLRCGKCRDACPTNALAVPYRLNYRRCLSYWTQAKEIMPDELRSQLGNRLYGCDSCLRACPLIKKSPREGVTVDLIKFATLTNREFRHQYGSSSVAWRGRTVLQRNAVLVLGNSGQKEVIPILLRLLLDPRASIRAAAAWSLGCYGGYQVQSALEKRLDLETEPSVRAEIVSAYERRST